MDSLFGVYTGIVIDSTGYTNVLTKEGTRFIGQVMVKINGITPALFNETYKAVPACNVNSKMDLRTAASTEVLAYVMQPVMGASTPGIYDSKNNSASPMRQNPARGFTKKFGQIGDSFKGGPQENNTARNNPYGNNYYPNYPWNTGLGSYSIPEVNTFVLVGFLNGARNLPVVLGKLPRQDELESFYKRDGAYVSAPSKSQNYTFGQTVSSNSEGTTLDNESSVAATAAGAVGAGLGEAGSAAGGAAAAAGGAAGAGVGAGAAIAGGAAGATVGAGLGGAGAAASAGAATAGNIAGNIAKSTTSNVGTIAKSTGKVTGKVGANFINTIRNLIP